MNRKISSEIVIAYAQCPRKAYLLLHSDELGKVNEYIAILERQKSANQNKYVGNLKQRKFDVQTYSDENLRNGSSFLIGGKLEYAGYEAVYGVLTKVSSPSSLGEHSYEPAIFIGTHQVNSYQKLELIFIGHILGQVQGKLPLSGSIIGTKLKSHKVSLESSYKILAPTLQNVQEISQIKPPESPSLILNKHCSCCQFQYLCQTQAEKEDNLSLLNHVSSKVLQRYEKKGIFTVKQLSYLYKPRRRNKRVNKAPFQLHKLELQALAIRTNKIYLNGLPQLVRKPVELFLDIEGIPDQQYEYLIGLIVCDETGLCKYYFFWADTRENEAQIWQQFTEIVKQYADVPIYHYGNYEARAISKLAKRYASNVDIEGIKNCLVNVNTYIYGQVYFPVYSNGLKAIGKFIGATWTSPKSSGLQSIVWRYHWENTQETKYRDLLITYNHEDCQALKLLTDKLSKIKDYADGLSEVEFADSPKRLVAELGAKLHNQFDTILKFAHADYDKKKISFRKDETSNDKANDDRTSEKSTSSDSDRTKKIGHTKLPPKVTKFVCVPTRLECPEHKGELLLQSERIAKCIIIDLIFSKSGIKKVVIEYMGIKVFCQKCKRHYNPSEIKIKYLAYGHGLQVWVVYNRLFLRLPYRIIAQALEDQFSESISDASIVNFLRYFNDFYSETEQLLIKNILKSPFVHADETIVNIQGVEQYVWVFTDGKHVILKLTLTREADIVHEFLRDYDGTLISDFYAGYDSVNCKQQKCWVHLIRDMNDDLWKSPFDSEFEEFLLEVRNLIVPILESVEEYGLKSEKLSKFELNVNQFYENTINKSYRSDLTLKYQKRFLRYRSSLFTFLKEDEIPWNNNTGERAIRHLAVQRKISGYFHKSLISQYLLLLGIMQTCRFQGKSFLKFLLSKEKDLDKFK